MIEYLRGKVVERTPTATVVEVSGGVGYLLSISLNTYNVLSREGEEYLSSWCDEVLREDTMIYMAL